MEKSFVLALIAAALCCRASSAAHAPEVRELVAWLEGAEGAVLHPGHEFRRGAGEDTGSETAPSLGGYATETIEEGEIIVRVPWELMVTAGFEYGGELPPLVCETAKNLAEQMRLGDASAYAPYTRFLSAQGRAALPSEWEPAAKNLFEEVLNDGAHPPYFWGSWIAQDWLQDCSGSPDPQSVRAAMHVVQRAQDDLLVPVYDLYQHRNPPYYNTRAERLEGKAYVLRAARTIEKGEQIYLSHNMCNHCGARAKVYGTPEIFRDYGFVEPYPQRWIFESRQFAFELREKEGGEGEVEVIFLGEDTDALQAQTVAYLLHEVDRLAKLRKLEEDNAEVSREELEQIWQYGDALRDALQRAARASIEANPSLLEEIGDTCAGGLGAEVLGGTTCSVSQIYDSLEDEADDMYFDDSDGHYYKPITCDNQDLAFFNDWNDVAMDVKSAYQTMSFFANPDTEEDDMCFDLDSVVQICASYRPHYHEYNMDYAARYLDKVKRVVFVGGGDSMLLYETLKYPDIELVLGLELDQKVVRQSFKYFHSSPHFEDDRVQWWFGDATKSLLMLPRDFFASFDLVLIDLSETVMALSVTDHLDIFGALSLLLRPGGIMVKNELYLEQMSELFDYTAQIYRKDLPIICDQVVVMGSNRIDFINAERTDHEVDTKLLEPITHHPLELFHDYRKTNARDQGKCDEELSADDDMSKFALQAGLLMIAEVENTTVPLVPISSLESIFTDVLVAEGLHPLPSVASANETVVVIPMLEGYIMARVWPKFRYCALDIHLWGMFNGLHNLRDALVDALGSTKDSLSSYKIVVGGMHGSNSWEEDAKTIGPVLEQRRNCDPLEYSEVGIEDESIHEVVLTETLGLVKSKTVAAVLCGVSQNDCEALALSTKKFKDVYFIPTCPDIVEGSEYDEDIASRMIECEKTTTNALKEAIEAEGQSIDAFIIDVSVPLPMVKIATSMWTSPRMRNTFMSMEMVFLALMPGSGRATRPKHNFMDRVRKAILFDPLHAVELVLTESDKTLEVAILSVGNPNFFKNLDKIANLIEDKTSLTAEIRKVQGGMVQDQTDDNYNPFKFKTSDYDIEPLLVQFENQKSLGRQNVFQLAFEDAMAESRRIRLASNSQVKEALETTINAMQYSIIELETVSGDIGDGSLTIAVMEEGNAIVVWDGDDHVDLSLFTYDESEELASNFLEMFISAFPVPLSVTLRDEQPRGINRVINFQEDLDYKRESRSKTKRKADKRCNDKHPSCHGWSKGGECERNPNFMLGTCMDSCEYPRVCAA